MNKRRWISPLYPLLMLVLVSCSGSTQLAGGGTGGTGVAMGTVTGFGSVFVNGVEYDTTGATISMNGESVGEADLEVGMIVTVRGVINSDGGTGIAQTIEYKKRILGPIEGTPVLSNNTLVVMGQTVRVTQSTLFSDATGAAIPITGLGDLVSGNFIEVSGFSNESGEVQATLVRLLPPPFDGLVELKGRITSVNSTATIFQIGSLLTVDYGSIADFTARQNDFVEVTGTYDPATRTLTATELSLGSEGITGNEGDEVEIEGIITDEGTDAEGAFLVINGQRVRVTETTELPEGFDLTSAVGTRVEIEGTLSADEIVADSLEIRREGDLEIKAEVQSVDESGSTVTLLGKTVRITPETVIDRKAEFFADLNDTIASTGSAFLSVHGYALDAEITEIIATQIEFESSGGATELAGAIDPGSYQAGSGFTISGIHVDVSGGPTVNELLATPADLDAFLQDATRVEVVGNVAVGDPNTVIAQDISTDQ